MDFSLITGSLGALANLVELGKAAKGVTDAAQASTLVAQMNDQVLNVQANLYRHQAELMDLQQKYYEAQQKIRDFEASANERDRYDLFEPHPGNFVYRLNKDKAKPGEPIHMLCQPCFDAGKKSVLRATSSAWAICQLCEKGLDIGPAERLDHYAERDSGWA